MKLDLTPAEIEELERAGWSVTRHDSDDGRTVYVLRKKGGYRSAARPDSEKRYTPYRTERPTSR